MPTPHATTPRSGSSKRPLPAPPGTARKAVPGIVAASRAPAVRVEEIGPERKWQMIAEAAYYRAEQRGFAPGFELDDWLDAEAEVEARLAR